MSGYDDDERPSPFLQIGDHIVNLNQVAHIGFDVHMGKPRAVLTFAQPASGFQLHLQGRDAERLRDVMAEYVDEACDGSEFDLN